MLVWTVEYREVLLDSWYREFFDLKRTKCDAKSVQAGMEGEKLLRSI